MSALSFSASVSLASSYAKEDIGITYISDAPYVPLGEEAAGKVGKFLGVIAAIAIPFAAPMVFSSIAASGVLGASMATAAGTTGFLSSMTGIVGSAITGGIMNAAAAYAGGARGGEVWQAFGTAALSSGIGAYGRGAAAVRGASQATTQAGLQTTSDGGAAFAGLDYNVGTQTSIADGAISGAGGATAPTTVSGTIMNGIRSLMPNISDPQQLNRIGAMIVNAAVNNQSLGQLDGLVAQQRAELDALAATNRAAYEQRISIAQTVLDNAKRMDPNWYARMAMADVAAIENKELDTAKRNIAVKQGGSLDAGQQKAYERHGRLKIGRDKALAGNRAFVDAQNAQNAALRDAAGLFGPDEMGFRIQQAGAQLDQDAYAERARIRHDTWAPVISGLVTPQHAPSTSPDPSTDEDEETFSSTFGGD